jgi:hypothetical protein
MDDAFLILTLWFLLVAPHRVALNTPSTKVPVHTKSPTAKGPVFHPIDNFVMNITAAAAIARQGQRAERADMVRLLGPNV